MQCWGAVGERSPHHPPLPQANPFPLQPFGGRPLRACAALAVRPERQALTARRHQPTATVADRSVGASFGLMTSWETPQTHLKLEGEALTGEKSVSM
jgi:hypothetical protein